MRALSRLTWIEFKLFFREPFSVIFTFAFPLIVLLVLIGSFSPDDTAFGGAPPSDYYLASYIGVVVGAVGLIVLPVHIATYRERGILRRFRASAVPTWNVIGAQMIVGIGTVLVGSITLVVAGRLLYDAALPAAPFRVLGALFLSTLTFLSIGFLLAVLTRNARAAQALGMLLFFPMWLLSGAGPPPEVMGSAMRSVSDFLPLTYAVRAIQDPWLGDGIEAINVIVLVALLVVSSVVASRKIWSA